MHSPLLWQFRTWAWVRPMRNQSDGIGRTDGKSGRKSIGRKERLMWAKSGSRDHFSQDLYVIFCKNNVWRLGKLAFKFPWWKVILHFYVVKWFYSEVRKIANLKVVFIVLSQRTFTGTLQKDTRSLLLQDPPPLMPLPHSLLLHPPLLLQWVRSDYHHFINYDLVFCKGTSGTEDSISW